MAEPARSTYLFPVRALSRHVRGGWVSHFGFLAKRLGEIRTAIADAQHAECADPNTEQQPGDAT